ncbi:hypothetical protein QVD17_03577 [Tagetes erecta]|uniref:Glutathione S-transferase n=1 Tax=Tagetes erecta TaxID=13708 RepID=A0AAD8P9U2_TARER|nr:hypothetical protein QVD17_03577 [Tagetes erecta]
MNASNKHSSPELTSMTKKCEMKLVGTGGSAFTTRVKFVLKLKSIEYEYFEEHYPKKSELLLQTNPVFQRVPVLIHGDQPPMIESLAIIEYLDEIKPDVHPLLPKDPAIRVHYRILAYTFDTLCYPWMKEFMTTRDDEKREELKQNLIGGSVMLEDAIGKFSRGKTFFGGDDVDYLDIVVGGFLGWMRFYDRVFGFKVITEERTPKLAKWQKSMWAHEQLGALNPTHETLKEFLQMLVDRLPPLPAST